MYEVSVTGRHLVYKYLISTFVSFVYFKLTSIFIHFIYYFLI